MDIKLIKPSRKVDKTSAQRRAERRRRSVAALSSAAAVKVIDRISELAGGREREIRHNGLSISMSRAPNIVMYSVWTSDRKVFSANRSLMGSQAGVLAFHKGGWIDDLMADNRNGLRRV